MCDQRWVAVIKDLKRQMRTMKKSGNELMPQGANALGTQTFFFFLMSSASLQSDLA